MKASILKNKMAYRGTIDSEKYNLYHNQFLHDSYLCLAALNTNATNIINNLITCLESTTNITSTVPTTTSLGVTNLTYIPEKGITPKLNSLQDKIDCIFNSL